MKILLITLIAVGTVTAAPTYLSPVTVVPSKDGKRLFVAAATDKRLVSVDLESKKTVDFALQKNPSGITASADGKTLFVTVGLAKGELVALDATDGKPLYSIPVGHSPIAPVCSADGKRVYLCNRFANTVIRVDLDARKVTGSVKVTREPVALALNKEGTRLFVANHLPSGSADGDRIHAVVDVIDAKTFARRKPIELVNGSFSLRSMALSNDGKWLYVPSNVGRFSVPTTQLERGWMNTSALNVINVEKEALHHTVLLDDVDRGAANPWGVACSADDRYVCVSHSSTHEVSVIDRNALFKVLEAVKPAHDYPSVADYEVAPSVPVNRLDTMVGIRRRVAVNADSPRGLAAIGGTVYSANYFSDSISAVDVAKGLATPIALGPKPELTVERQGEIYFNDATYCFQNWQSCTSCHPDSRADALNWDLLNDGMGNPKNTKSLLNSHVTPPVMISGIRPDAETAVRAGIKYIMFAVPKEDRAKPIDAYLKSLTPVPSPYLVDGKLSPAAARGQDVFASAGCIACHDGPYHTDRQKYDVGTALGMDKGKKMDTPQLVEVWRTAPYLLDGRAATLKEAFTKHNKKNLHGTTSNLSEKELNDLIEYLNSL